MPGLEVLFMFSLLHINGIQYTWVCCTNLEFHLLEVKHTDLWEFVDDIEPVVLLVRHWIP